MCAVDRTRTPATGFALCFILTWLLFMIVAWILIVVGLSRQEWVTGTETIDATHTQSMDVGLFRQCTGGHCYHVSDMNIELWRAAAAFFVIGIVLLSIVIIMGLLCMCFLQLLPWTKLLLSIVNLCMVIAIILIPIGFTYLDDDCPPGNDQPQCGLICDDNGRMDFFSLCSPFKVGAALWVLIAGIFVLFVGSLIISCLQTRTYIVSG